MANNIDAKEAAIGSQFGIKMLDAETETENNSATATAQARAQLASDIAKGGTRGTRLVPSGDDPMVIVGMPPRAIPSSKA